jgi:hypothetical protein
MSAERSAVGISLEIGVKKAIQWISERRKESPSTGLALLVEEACRKFDLSPVQADFLYRHFTKTETA